MLTALASALIAVLIAGALSAGRACAHDPRFACSPRDTNDPVVVADPQKSWAFYGHLRAGEEDRYAIETPKAVAVPVQLLVDRRDANNSARPVATIANTSGHAIATIDFEQTQRFFEPFSRVTYLATSDRVVAFPAGTSTITVTMHGIAAPQRYTLAIGSEERFSLLEMPYLLGALYRIHTRSF
jgi:hypothetical protein